MTSKLIIIGGLPGTGKTTIANALSGIIGVPAFSKDVLEAAIVRTDIASTQELKSVGYELLASLAINELSHGRSVILDCIASSDRVRKFWSDLLDENTKYIECICSNNELHKQRLKSRVRKIKGWYEITWDDVLNIQKTYQPFSEDRLILDSVDKKRENLNKAVHYIQN